MGEKKPDAHIYYEAVLIDVHLISIFDFRHIFLAIFSVTKLKFNAFCEVHASKNSVKTHRDCNVTFYAR